MTLWSQDASAWLRPAPETGTGDELAPGPEARGEPAPAPGPGTGGEPVVPADLAPPKPPEPACGPADEDVVLEPVRHIVVKGETVVSIAARYGVSVDTVTASAGLRNPNRIYPGQVLVFPPVDGVLHRVRSGETLGLLAQAYGVDPLALARANGIADPDRLEAGRVLVVPGAAPRPAGTLARSSTPAASTASTSSSTVLAAGALSWPVRGAITSAYGPRWGRMHTGIDISASPGTTIRAAASGKVIFAGWWGEYGRCVILEHGNGVTTLYGHASAILVVVGQDVARGEAVARVGSSGRSTGPHLHFEVRVNGRTQNPLAYLGD